MSFQAKYIEHIWYTCLVKDGNFPKHHNKSYLARLDCVIIKNNNDLADLLFSRIVATVLKVYFSKRVAFGIAHSLGLTFFYSGQCIV